MVNRLADAASPYLRQHRDNPVAWFPWGEEAFARARAEDRPVLLSIGYASCHWCHVMAHECFEDEGIAALMNAHFVNVKVDREERPDVDAVYMHALQAMTGSGGWPMTVVVTPDGAPFFAGTYFPPEDRPGQPGLPRVLRALAQAWRERRGEVLEAAAHMEQALKGLEAAPEGRASGADDTGRRDAAVLEALLGEADPVHGGFGGAPKFPPHSVLRYLLGRPEEQAWSMAARTLRAMADGGLHDQLDGGFARYAVDVAWRVPHFEKMLGDNGQLLRSYAAAFARDGDRRWAEVAGGIVAWLADALALPGGGLASALDADSEGEEGRFYTWEPEELRSRLGADAAWLSEVWGVSATGDVDGRCVLRVARDPWEAARAHGVPDAEVPRRLERARATLVAARAERPRPARDDKVLTSWNGLALVGLAEAARVLGDDRAEALARANAAYVRRRLWRDGRLWHRAVGDEVGVEGLLEDYAFYGLGVLALNRLDPDPELLRWAFALGEAVLERFEDREGGGFFSTAVDAEPLLVRPRGWMDADTPAENAAAAELLAELARHSGEARWRSAAERALAPLGDAMIRHPRAFAGSLVARGRLEARPREVVLVGAPGDAGRRRLVEVWRRFADDASAVIGLHRPDEPGLSATPLGRDRTAVAGRATAYVCEGGRCLVPATDADAFAEQLREAGLRERPRA